MENQTILLVLTLLGSLISGTFGFGSGIFLIGAGSLFFSLKFLVPLTSILLLNPVVRVFLYKNYIPWKIFRLAVVPAILGVILGYQFFDIIDERTLSIIIGVGLLVYVFFAWKKQKSKNVFHRESQSSTNLPIKSILFFNFLSGITTGIGAPGSPVRIALNTALPLSTHQFIALASIQSLVAASAKLIAMFHGKYLSLDQWLLYLQIVLIGVGGNLIGKKFLKYLCPKKFAYGVLIILSILAVKMIL